VNIYVGNLSFDTDDAALRAAFEAFGEVTSAQVITDRDTGRSRGFGFVEMPSDDEAKAAISGLDGTDLDGRALKVNPARPRGDRSGGGGSRGRGGYGGGGGGGGGRRSW
jgi:RNA recognition motif-containing protein